MTDRARRLARYLENELDWTVLLIRDRNCPKCKARAHDETDRFCHACGTKLAKVEAQNTEVYDEIEAAIAYALREKK